MNTLKKALLGSAALLGAGAFTGTAVADVFVVATIDKHKDKTVTETLTKTKTVTLEVSIARTLNEAAESEAVANQRNSDNSVDYSGAGLTSTIEAGSVSNNSGVTQVNEDVGNMVNQGNVLAFGNLAGPNDKFVEAQASAMQLNGVLPPLALAQLQQALRERYDDPNLVVDPGSPNSVTVGANVFVTANIGDSINGNSGVTQANQNAGNLNNQLNELSIAAGVDTEDTAIGGDQVVALAEADLGQFNTKNVVNEPAVGNDVQRTAGMTDSMIGNTGITQATQAVGNMVNQANVVAMGAAVASQ